MGIADDKKKATGAGTVGGAAVGGVAGGAAAGAAAGGMTGPVGAAVGAAVGAGIGAASGRAASERETMHGEHSAHTVIAAFDDEAQAQRALEQLTTLGFDRSDIHLERDQAQQRATGSGEEHPTKHGFFAWLFGDDTQYEQQRNTYDEAVRRGSSIVVVDARDDEEAERAASCLHDLGAIDVDERARQWQQEGWTGRRQAPVSDAGQPGSSKEGVLDVVQEELQVGKRQLDRGGVRVVQRVSERPVREVVRLREEQAMVDRRAVDRPATADDLNTFQEGTMEIRETVEEPVVAKSARVVEEVRVGKEVREREQVVEDTVRRKDVDVERADGTRSTERERAVAADDSRQGESDDTRTGQPGDKPRKNL